MSDMLIAKSVNDLPDLDYVLSRTGLELMQDIVARKIAGPPIGATLGFRPILAEDGKVVFEGTPEFNVLNPLGTVHGGWYGAILDSCMACAVQTKLKLGQIIPPLNTR